MVNLFEIFKRKGKGRKQRKKEGGREEGGREAKREGRKEGILDYGKLLRLP